MQDVDPGRERRRLQVLEAGGAVTLRRGARRPQGLLEQAGLADAGLALDRARCAPVAAPGLAPSSARMTPELGPAAEEAALAAARSLRDAVDLGDPAPLLLEHADGDRLLLALHLDGRQFPRAEVGPA